MCGRYCLETRAQPRQCRRGWLLDGVVLDDLTQHTTVTTADDENTLGLGCDAMGRWAIISW